MGEPITTAQFWQTIGYLLLGGVATFVVRLAWAFMRGRRDR